jgi:hypothetical protein
MRHPGDRRRMAGESRGEGRHHDSELIERHVSQVHLPALGFEQPAQVELFGRAGNGRAGFVRLGVDLHVFQEAVEEGGHAN